MAELILAFISGLLGYAFGISGQKGFEDLIKYARSRVDKLAYFKVTPPFSMFKECNIPSSFYREAVQAYILGMPNASVVMSLKTLELGLKCRLGEKKKNLYNLIKNLEGEEQYKDLAHGFRILRNLIVHDEKECKEQDAIEALRHVSEILNKLFPFKGVRYTITCNNCKTDYEIELDTDEFFLGNIIRTSCPKCKVINPLIIGTEWGVPQVY